MKKTLIFAALVLFFASASAEPFLPKRVDQYYGRDLQNRDSESFKEELHQVLSSYHISKDNDFDQIVEKCSEETNQHCYTHTSQGYKRARQFLFGFLYLSEINPKSYSLATAYCEANITSEDLPELGPMVIPNSNVVNAEHAWPQSFFTNDFPKNFQKADLHILYPVEMKVNSTRSNHPFGEVTTVTSTPCAKAVLGKDSKGRTVFEPAPSIKGDIARSLFYFSIRYKAGLDSDQEKVLRRWHEEDPVDQDEFQKHQETFEIQFVRNPFIDHPEWVGSIQDF